MHRLRTVLSAPSFQRGVTVLTLLVVPALSWAVELKDESLQAWKEYIQAATARNEDRLHEPNTFLASDEIPGQLPKLRQGSIIVSPAGRHTPLKVPSGLIHDWTGAAFIPNATLEQVLTIVRNYDRYKEIYHPNVVDSKLIDLSPTTDRFSMVLANRSVVHKTALDTRYESAHQRLGDRRYYTTIEMTRVQEIANYGNPTQRMLPEGEGSGLIWRLFSISRLEERDGGVYIELEAIALSRDIPAGVRWFVEPIVRRVSRSALATSLGQTREAVGSDISVARNSNDSAAAHMSTAH